MLAAVLVVHPLHASEADSCGRTNNLENPRCATIGGHHRAAFVLLDSAGDGKWRSGGPGQGDEAFLSGSGVIEDEINFELWLPERSRSMGAFTGLETEALQATSATMSWAGA